MRHHCGRILNEHENIFHTLSRLHRAKLMELMNDTEIFPGQIPILMAVKSNDGCTQKELSNLFKYRPASISDSLKRLEKAEYILRKQDEKDLRITRVCVTEKGLELLKKALDTYNSMEDVCYTGFTEDEKTQLNVLLRKVIKNLETKEDIE